jgi:hypothetical protein
MAETPCARQGVPRGQTESGGIYAGPRSERPEAVLPDRVGLVQALINNWCCTAQDAGRTPNNILFGILETEEVFKAKAMNEVDAGHNRATTASVRQEEEEENINQVGLPLVKTEAGCENIHYHSWRRPTCQDCHRTWAHLIRV